MTVDFIGSIGKEFTESPGRERNKEGITVTGFGAILVTSTYKAFQNLVDNTSSLNGFRDCQITERQFDSNTGVKIGERIISYHLPINGIIQATLISQFGTVNISEFANYLESTRTSQELIAEWRFTGFPYPRNTTHIELQNPFEIDDYIRLFVDSTFALNNFGSILGRYKVFILEMESFTPILYQDELSTGGGIPAPVFYGASVTDRVPVQEIDNSLSPKLVDVRFNVVDMRYEKQRFPCGNNVDWTAKLNGLYPTVQTQLSCSLKTSQEILYPPGQNGDILGAGDIITEADMRVPSGAGEIFSGVFVERKIFPPQAGPEPGIVYYSHIATEPAVSCAPWIA